MPEPRSIGPQPGDPAAAPPWLDSPEFEAAVEKAAAAIAARVANARGAPALPGDVTFAQQLALQIAELSDQGTSWRRRVAPEVMAKRQAGLERLQALLAEAQAAGAQPLWELKNKVQMRVFDEDGKDLGEGLIEPLYHGTDRRHYPTQLRYLGIPSLAMKPADDWARRIYAAFEDWTGFGGADLRAQQLKLLPNGVVIVSGAVNPDVAVPQLGGPGSGGLPAGTGAVVRRQTPARETKSVHVLGTIAEPARENP